MSQNFDQVYQFRITLDGIEPPIWRRIQVPSSYSFWDLHVAIQDAMGWLDYHLHLFSLPSPQSGERVQIGIPDVDLFEGDEPVLPGSKTLISEYLSISNAGARYEYDFGDGWLHEVILEDVLPCDGGIEYPRCVAGDRSCPPEDVGGVYGYEDFLTAIADPEHEQHEEMLEWVGGDFDPEDFNPKHVMFDDPAARWQDAFGSFEGRGTSDPGDTQGPARAGPPPGFASPPFEHFSPAEMHGLLHTPFDDRLSPLVLNTDLEDEAFEGASFVSDAARYLRMLRERQPVKLTQAGNLPRRLVRELWEAGVPAEGREWIHRPPAKEMDARVLHTINLLTAKSGLARKRKGKLSLTRKAERLLDKEGLGALFLHLFKYYTSTYNWGYEDLFPESWIVQGGFGYSLYLVQKYGTERRETRFYAEHFQRAFPPAIDDFRGTPYSTPKEVFADTYSVRVLTGFLARFGLADVQTEGDSIFDQETYLTSTPLLNRLVGWKAIEPPDPEVLPSEPLGEPARSEAGVLRLPQNADLTIDEVFDHFLNAQRVRLKPRTVAKYEAVIDMFRTHLNNYASDALSDVECALFDQYDNAEGRDRREFCQIFGPEKILENLDGFFGYFMTRKVIGSTELKKAAGTVTRKLCGWLKETGLVEVESAEISETMAAEAGRDLPRAEEAAQILFEAAEELSGIPAELDDKDYVEFSHHTIVKVGAGVLWLQVYEGCNAGKIGPIPVPKEATDLLQVGWDISCALGRVRGAWQLIEVANVYPS